jgi:hypothetical protein
MDRTILDHVRKWRRKAMVAAAALAIFLGYVAWVRHGTIPTDPAQRAPDVAPQAALARPGIPAEFRAVPPQARQLELCGFGPIQVVDGIPQLPPGFEAASQRALERLVAELGARSSEHDRAIGWYFSGRQHELIRLATSTSDADVYALAIHSCASSVGDGAQGDCAELSFGQWARIEPGNAAPWLDIAHDALLRGDKATVDDAMFRASKSQYNDYHDEQFDALIASDFVARQSEADQTGITISIAGVKAAVAIPSLTTPGQYCDSSVATHPYRVQVCGDLAAMLMRDGRSLIDVYIGSRIASRVGWSDSRLRSLRDEGDALRQVEADHLAQFSVAGDWGMSCDAQRNFRRDSAVIAKLGQAAKFRQALKESWIPIPDLAARWRAKYPEVSRQR